MTQIIVNDDQVRAVRQAADTVEICDESGVLVGYVTRRTTATSEEIAEARKRAASAGPWHTTEQFLAELLRSRPMSEPIPTTPGRFVGKFSRVDTHTDG